MLKTILPSLKRAVKHSPVRDGGRLLCTSFSTLRTSEVKSQVTEKPGRISQVWSDEI